MWSYPNLHRSQRAHGRGDGKELCDLLVVFDQHVFIFSDKHCQLQGADPQIAWKRWYRRAVVKSAAQAAGAERWLRSHPDRVYLDKACERPLPIELPKSPTFHRILTCRGATDASRTSFGGSGSLIVTNRRLDECLERPLQLGALDREGRVHHVIDDASLDALLLTFDTIADFVDYLVERERLLTAGPRVIAAGEDELTGYYLLNFDEAEQRHRLVPDDPMKYSQLAIDEGHWDQWLTSKQRAAKCDADLVSYGWDELIDRFAFHILGGTQYFATELPPSEHEQALRWMAREPRVRRRFIARWLVNAIQTTQADQIRRTLLRPSHPGDPHWVFLVLPRPASLDQEAYREARHRCLLFLIEVAKYVCRDATDIVGLAINPDRNEVSEDLVYADVRDWTEENYTQAAETQARTGFFTSEVIHMGTEYNFPIVLPDDDET